MADSPPQPTDLHSSMMDVEEKRCSRCLDLEENMRDHNCEVGSDEVTNVTVNNQFGIVVPGRTGYIWSTKTRAFAISHVNIQGTYIPIGKVTKSIGLLDDDGFPVDVDKIDFQEFSDQESESNNYDYRVVDLGKKLVRERIEGVYESDEELKQQKLETRDDRIQEVWKVIDQELPFSYERVSAPEGYPRTCEGMRWISVTGHNHPDYIEEDQKCMYEKDWVGDLIGSEPVALYYPNSD